MVLVRDVMSEDLVCVNATDLVSKARSIMRKQGFRMLPVIDDGQFVGIISRGDVMQVTSTKTNLTVGGIMNRSVAFIAPDADIYDAVNEIVSANVRQLPVVDDELRGIISSMDILKVFVEHNHAPNKKKVGDIMTRDVVSCSPADDMASIWNKMEKTGFSGLPVLEDGVVVGIIARMDAIRQGSARISKESDKPKTTPVKRVMRSRVHVIGSGDSVVDVAQLMVTERVSRVPVVAPGDKLVGIIDIEDVLKAYV